MEFAVGPYHLGTSMGSVKARQTAARGARKLRSTWISVSEGRLSVEAPWVLVWAMARCITSWLHNHLVIHQPDPVSCPKPSPSHGTATPQLLRIEASTPGSREGTSSSLFG